MLGAIAGLIALLSRNRVRESPEAKAKPKYEYKRKSFFMTRTEQAFYKGLVQAVGSEFFIFPQAHLPTLIDEKVPGQDWRAARSHVNRKSVDFVLCDKEYISPKLAIELDDSSHERQERIERDREVERIFDSVGMPLLRVEYRENLSVEELASRIREKLPSESGISNASSMSDY